jgi:hypothetical protein
MKKITNEALNVTSDQLSKDASLKNYMKSPDGKKTDINIVDKNKPNSATATNSTSPTTTTLEEDAMVDAQPQLKKLSLLVDIDTGQLSQPFEINGKRYQMVRAIDQNRKVVRGVEDMTDKNIYHEEDFDRNIATPARDMEQGPMTSIDPPQHQMQEMVKQNDNEAYIDYLNLNDLKGYKDFFVNPKTGEVVAKFKNARDMIKSGTKLEEDHDYMDTKQLRRLRFSNSMKSDSEDVSEDVDLGKLQNDVKRLSKLIKDKFMIALEKINTPIEQSQFLVAMANEIGVPFAKLTSIINSFKDISKDQGNDTPVVQMNTSSTTSAQGIAAESKIITKNQLAESIKPSNKIKIKDIRNGRL